MGRARHLATARAIREGRSFMISAGRPPTEAASPAAARSKNGEPDRKSHVVDRFIIGISPKMVVGRRAEFEVQRQEPW